MPQTLSLFPAAAPTPPPRPAITPSSNGDGNSASFDNVLDGARKDAQQASKPADPPTSASSTPTTSTDKSAKPAKAKPGKPAQSKKAGKSRADDGATDDDDTDADPADAKSSSDASLQTDPVLPVESADAPVTPKPKSAKTVAKPADAADGTAALVVPQPPPPPKNTGVQPSEKKPASATTKPVDGVTVARAKPVAGEQDPDDTADASGASGESTSTAAATAKQAGGAAHRADAKAASSKDPQGVAPQQASADTGIQAKSNPGVSNPAIANAAASVSDDDDDDDAAAPTPAATANAHDASAPAPATPQPALHGFAAALAAAQPAHANAGASNSVHVAAAVPLPPPPTPAQFAETNHAQIVSGIKADLLPNGGSMQIRLDPPDLGAMNVSVHLRDGVLTASFQTSTDQASRLLSHSLGQLKTALESQGVSVGSLNVQQTPRDPQSNSNSQEDQNGRNGSHDNPAQQEQQRREMLRKMWARLNGGKDPLDMVA